jgi:hypothetical protein
MNYFLKICFIIVFAGQQSFATNYYVSNTGNDSNSGTSIANAWETITKINGTIFNPGDIILFEGGETFSGSLFFDSNDANGNTNYVTITSFGTSRATIDAGNDYGITIYNTAGIEVNELIFSGSGVGSNSNSGIIAYNDLSGNIKLNEIKITNCEVFGFRDYGIQIGSENEISGFNNVLIENNKVFDCLDNGIGSYGEFSSTKVGYAHSNIIVRNCEVYNITGYNVGSHSGNGIVLSDVQNSTVEYCVVYDCGSGNTNCGGPVGIWYWDSDNVTIQYSEAYNISSGTGCDGAGFDLDGGTTNGTMQYNYSHDNDGGGFLVGQFSNSRPMNNIIVRYNISENDGLTNRGSIFLFNLQNPMSNIYIYNNTIYSNLVTTNNSNAIIRFLNASNITDNININNNIFFTENTSKLIDIPNGHSVTIKGNSYYATNTFEIDYLGTTYNSLTSFQNTGQETNNFTPIGYQGNPLLTDAGNGGVIGFGNSLEALNAYKLLDTSPLIDSGFNTGFTIGDTDFYGGASLINSIQDIGAHEFDSSVLNIESNQIYINSVFPNPIKENLQIQFKNNLNINKINIININGKIVYAEIINDMIHEKIINLESLSNGFYILKIIADNQSYKYKIIKS